MEKGFESAVNIVYRTFEDFLAISFPIGTRKFGSNLFDI